MKKIILAVLLILFIIFAILFFKGNSKDNFIEVQNIAENYIEEKEEKEIVENDLKGKSIAFIGDSLIEGYGNDFKGFDYYLSQELPNTNFINNSKSGSTVTDNSGDDNIVMINQAQSLEGNPDIIVFDGGANDIIGYSLGFLNNDLKKNIGTVNMNDTSVTEEDSVIQDFEEVIEVLKTKFPNAKLCYLQPFLLDAETVRNLTNDIDAQNEIISRRDYMFSEIQKMCIKWKIDYLDVSNEFKDTGLTYRNDDWIHINEAGYKILILDILQKLKEI